MKYYTLINDADDNEQHKIEAKNYLEALEQALELLGWWLAKDSKE